MQLHSELIIVGGGHAGVQAAASCRSLGYLGRITIISDEKSSPYHRPPLSKSFLHGVVDHDGIRLQHDAFYQSKNIRVLNGRKVIRILRDDNAIELEDGAILRYETLLLAL